MWSLLRLLLLIGCLVFLPGLLIRPVLIPEEPDDQLLERVPTVATYEGPRSSGWATVRNRHVAVHPRCEACGSVAELNVHHLQPFHEHPELELDPDNLITLCRKHHFWIGHHGNWSEVNLNCLYEVKEYKKRHPWR
jgi:5-methylcytosine-specific restriction protein A